MTPSEWIAALGEAAAKARAEAGQADLHVVVAGLPIRFRIAPESMRALLDPLAVTNGSAQAHRTIELWEVAASGVAPPRLPPEAREAGAMGAITWLSSPTTAGTFHEGGPILVAWDAAAKTVSGWIGDITRLAAWERAAPLRAPLNWILRGPRRALVHAAAIGPGGGGPGLLIGGPSGSGKSTTALSWLLSGGDFAGENDVLVDLDGSGGPAAAPVYANAKVDAETIRLLPELAATAGPGDDELHGKSVLDIRELRPGQPTGPIPIGAIVIPRVARVARPEVKPIPGSAALRALAPSSLLQLPGERGGLAVMAALVRELPCYEAELALDTAANLDALERVLPA
jgi:hypothetical protein